MKVLVVGATGRLGSSITKRLLNEGHDVTAFARRAADEMDHSPNLTCRNGDVFRAQDVDQAVQGQDVVVVALGAGMKRKGVVRSEGTLNVIKSMQKHGVDRLICQSTLGAHESKSNLNFFWKRIMFGLLLRPVLKDHELQEMLVRASGLKWTIVRPSAFDEGPETAQYKENFGTRERGLNLKISTADIAGFVARQLTEYAYLNRAVGISN